MLGSGAAEERHGVQEEDPLPVQGRAQLQGEAGDGGGRHLVQQGQALQGKLYFR